MMLAIDASLRAELERWDAVGRPDGEGARMLPVAVRLAEPLGDEPLPGLHRETATARVHMGRVALRDLDALASDARVSLVVLDKLPPPPTRSTTEWVKARGKNQNDGAWSLNAADRPDGLTGAGVTIGVIDTGIDVTNPAFWAPDALGRPTTRILSIWDMGLTPTGAESAPIASLMTPGTGGPAPTGTPIGVEYEHAAINAYLRGTAPVSPPFRHRDPEDHGTPIAAIAAGDPSHIPAAPLGVPALHDYRDFVGIAPKAEICVVRLLDAGVTSFNARLVDAVRYIVNKARHGRPGRPVVINMSFGAALHHHLGPGLEQDIFEDLFDDSSVLGAEFPTGVVAVTSAGNERAWGLEEVSSSGPTSKELAWKSRHSLLHRTSAAPTRFSVLFSPKRVRNMPRSGSTAFEVQIYYSVTAAMQSGADLNLDAVRLSRTFQDANGNWQHDSLVNMTQRSSEWREPSKSFSFLLVGETDQRRLMDIALPPNLSFNRFRIKGKYDNALLRRQTASFVSHFEIEAPIGAKFFIWTSDELQISRTFLVDRQYDATTPRQLTTLTDMGSVRDVVSVAALNAQRTGAADTSSCGPLAVMGPMGAPIWAKPDIAAPGERILCASARPTLLSGPAATDTDPRIAAEKPTRRVSGTSVAAPVVAGAAALMYEVAPTLPAAVIRALMRDPANCRKLRDPPVAAEYPHYFGGGGLDVVKLVAAARAHPGSP